MISERVTNELRHPTALRYGWSTALLFGRRGIRGEGPSHHFVVPSPARQERRRPLSPRDRSLHQHYRAAAQTDHQPQRLDSPGRSPLAVGAKRPREAR
jgi:hypothetical protein